MREQGAGVRKTEATALADVKVLDLSWALVGPAAMRVLGDFGATVVRVESSVRIDPVRAGPPFWRGEPGTERSANVVNYNVNKRMIQLDLGNPQAREVLLQLVDWCDIAIESFVPGVMERWNLHYEMLRARKPDLIMLSTCLNGQTGPDRTGAGYGVGGAARAAMIEVLGWPDRDPSLARAYTDYTASRMVTIAALAALDHRRRTGEGQYIDLSQVEASIPFLGPAVLEASVNGRVLRRRGNRVPGVAPHGVFACAGEDRWIAIAVESEAEWQALCAVAGQGWAVDERFVDVATREANQDALEASIGAWTSGREAQALEAALQAAGVAAHAVLDSLEGDKDGQLQAVKHFVEIESSDLGTIPVENSRQRLSRTPSDPRWVGTYGEDNDYVLRELLGLDDAAIAEIAASGALQ
ncbi:MAG: benzylsuccinate CoA-transferase BbsF subunit [Chloroflexi bacterium]|nr:MAG: benzylsuccinate CoA-transferase BbsF subunit [Chloroflexota bacterium]